MKKVGALLLTVVMMTTLLFSGVIPAAAETENGWVYTVENGEATIISCDRNLSGAVTVPSTLGGYPVTAIRYSAFWQCKQITDVTISNGIKSIGDQAFMFCEKMETVSIPASVTSIGIQAFARCDVLKSITVAANNTAYCTENGILFNKAKTTLMHFPAGKTDTAYTVPSTVTRIDSSAFGACKNLMDINIPSSVQSIGPMAFDGCGMYNDYNNWERRSLVIDGFLVAIDSSLESTTAYTMLENVKRIADYTFSWCGRLKSIDLPETLVYIGEGAFEYCELLQTVNFAGTQAQWNAVVVAEYNEPILNATKVFQPSGKKGWTLEGGKWYYYTNNVKVVNKWMKDSKGWVYLGADGAMKTNAWCTDSNGWCYVGADGYAVTNTWKKDSKGWIYLNANGSMTKSKWVQTSGKWYYCDANGYMVANKWMKDSKGWVYLGSDGAMKTNAWVRDSIGWCYVGADGYAVTNCWKKDSVGWCYLNSNGSMTKSAWVQDDGKWYYCDANGYMVANKTVTISGKKYTFNASGVWVK